MGKTKIYKGILSGVVTSSLIDNTFLLKLDEPIEDAPEEVVAYVSPKESKKNPAIRGIWSLHLRTGDRVRVEVELESYHDKFWDKDVFRLRCERVYNETLKCGFS